MIFQHIDAVHPAAQLKWPECVHWKTETEGDPQRHHPASHQTGAAHVPPALLRSGGSLKLKGLKFLTLFIYEIRV